MESVAFNVHTMGWRWYWSMARFSIKQFAREIELPVGTVSAAPIESFPSISEVRKYAMATRSALNAWLDRSDLEGTNADSPGWAK